MAPRVWSRIEFFSKKIIWKKTLDDSTPQTKLSLTITVKSRYIAMDYTLWLMTVKLQLEISLINLVQFRPSIEKIVYRSFISFGYVWIIENRSILWIWMFSHINRNTFSVNIHRKYCVWIHELIISKLTRRQNYIYIQICWK